MHALITLSLPLLTPYSSSFYFVFFLPLLLFPHGPADLFDLSLNVSRHLQQEFGALVVNS